MSLKIRLARAGAKKRPYYRIVIADSRSPRDGRFIERIGSYDPMVPKDHPERVRLDPDRAKYWLSVGAKPSDRVTRFLADAELASPRPLPAQTKKNQPKAKSLERLKEREEKEKEKAAAAKETAPEETSAEEPPSDETAAGEPSAEEEKKD